MKEQTHSLEMPLMYDGKTHEFRPRTANDIFNAELFVSSYGPLANNILMGLLKSRYDYWTEARAAGFVEGDDPSHWPKIERILIDAGFDLSEYGIGERMPANYTVWHPKV